MPRAAVCVLIRRSGREAGEQDGAAIHRGRGAGRPLAAAYDLARPLFASYPASYAVQDLRCQLATVRWLDRSAMLEECAPAGRLANAGAPK